MTDLSSQMYKNFDDGKFQQNFEGFLKDNDFHLTSRESLRCFLVALLTNIFHSPVCQKLALKTGYLASTPNFVYFLSSNTDSEPKFEFFVFDLAIDDREATMAQLSADNLSAMLLADKLYKFLPKTERLKKIFSKHELPNAKVIKLSQEPDGFYKVLT